MSRNTVPRPRGVIPLIKIDDTLFVKNHCLSQQKICPRNTGSSSYRMTENSHKKKEKKTQKNRTIRGAINRASDVFKAA